MPEFFNRFRKSIISSLLRRGKKRKPEARNLDNKIALGVLLWGMGAVAGAEGEFFPEETKKIKEILLTCSKVSKQDFPIVLTAMRQAAMEKINVYRIARGLNKKLTYQDKTLIITNLFRVAYADGRLGRDEFKVIRRIAVLFRLVRGDMIDARQKAKREMSL